MSTIFQGNHDLLKQVVEKMYEKKKALYVHGTFGIGKTVSIREIAKMLAASLNLEFSEDKKDRNNPKKFCFIPLIMHLFDEAELKGVPFPDDSRTRTIFLPVGTLPDKGQGILFLDEMNLARPGILNSGYQLTEEGRVGDYELPEGYLCIAAGNLVDDRGNTYDVPMPLNNRFFHFQLNPPEVESWVKDFAIPNGIDHKIVNYLMQARGKLYAFKPDSDTDRVAVATPRMWEKISDMIIDIPPQNLDEIGMYVSMGAGTDIGLDFKAWLKLSAKYDVSKILAGEPFKFPTDDVGLMFALISGVVGYYAEKINPVKDEPVESPKCAKLNKLSVDLMVLASKFSKEHGALLMIQAKNVDPSLHPRIKNADKEKYIKFSRDIFPFLI